MRPNRGAKRISAPPDGHDPSCQGGWIGGGDAVLPVYHDLEQSAGRPRYTRLRASSMVKHDEQGALARCFLIRQQFPS